MASNVTTKPTTDRHTVRGGEREARLGEAQGRGRGGGGYGCCNIKQSGAWWSCSSSMPVDSTRTAPAGPGSSCDWLSVPVRATLAPSVALTTTKPAKNARQGSWSCQAGWGGHLSLRNRATTPRTGGAGMLLGGGPHSSSPPPAFPVLFLHCRNWPTVAHLWLALAPRRFVPSYCKKKAIDELCEAVSSLRRAERRQQPRGQGRERADESLFQEIEDCDGARNAEDPSS